VTEALQQEIRTLKNIFESERDPEGRVFAPLADAYRRAGELQQAIRLLNEGLARHPDFVPGHVVAAQLYVEQGLAEEGAIAARKALALDAENVNAMRALLTVLEGNGDDEADEVRARLIDLEPGFAQSAGSAAAPSVLDDVGAGPVDRGADTVELTAVDEPATSAPVDETVALGALPDDFDLEGSGGEALDVSMQSEALSEDEPSGIQIEPAPEGVGSAGEPLIDLSLLTIPEADAPVGVSGLGPISDDELPTEEPVVDLDDLPVLGTAAAEAAAAPALEPSSDELPGLDDGVPTAFEEPVVALDDLGPEDAVVTDLDDLAPTLIDEPAMELSDLAPSDADDESAWAVMELDELAPAAADEDDAVMELGALAPDEPDDVVDLAELAPPEEEVVDLADLAPAAEADELVMDLTDLAPSVEDAEPVMDLADLAPPADEAEPAMDLADLAPEADDGVMDLAELAPAAPDDDTVMDLGALAPDEPEEVVSLADLAPSEEDAIDLADLAPEELEEDAMDLADLAPEELEEDAMDLADLAPSEPEEEPVALSDLAPEADEGPAMDLGALAPDEDEVAPVADLASLAPDGPEDDEAAVMDLGSLAPEEGPEPALVDLEPEPDSPEEPGAELQEWAPEVDEPSDEPATELDALAPDEVEAPPAQEEVTMVDLVDQTADADEAETADADEGDSTVSAATDADDDDDHMPGEPVYTKTLAELYVKQGAIGQALEVYRHLAELHPGDGDIARRIVALESGGGVEEGHGVLSDETEEEVEALARELSEHGNHADHDVDSPYTLHEPAEAREAEAEEPAEEGPTIGDYFEGLLGWRSEKHS